MNRRETMQALRGWLALTKSRLWNRLPEVREARQECAKALEQIRRAPPHQSESEEAVAQGQAALKALTAAAGCPGRWGAFYASAPHNVREDGVVFSTTPKIPRRRDGR